jgi:hypothetical protein
MKTRKIRNRKPAAVKAAWANLKTEAKANRGGYMAALAAYASALRKANA